MHPQLAIRILIAAVAAFIASSVYYGAFFGAIWREMAGLGGDVAPWQIAAQFARNLLVASALATILRLTGREGLLSSLPVSLLIWLGFSAMAIAGSIIHEAYPVPLYLIHTGDALLAILVMTVALAWSPRRGRQAVKA